MLGQDFQTFKDFKQACNFHSGPLSTAETLSKAYQVDHLRCFAEKIGIDISDSSEDGLTARMGVGARYNAAIRLSKALGDDPEEIGRTVARWDHDLIFPIVTYRQFPSTMAYTSSASLLPFMQSELVQSLESGFAMNHNGMRWAHGRAPKLESMLYDPVSNVISLLFSCTRILSLPDRQGSSVEDCFLARIPVLVRLLFHHRLFEISMPTFSEVPAASSSTPSRVPERYQTIIETTLAALVQLVPDQPSTIDFRKATLYLELELGAEDLGWIIEPIHAAKFDLAGAIPLKRVLDSLSEDFKAECKKQGRPSHPLAEMDFYKIFRALKEQSYTYSVVLRAPLGSRQGNYQVSALYGPENSNYEPIFWIFDNKQAAVESMRSVVQHSQYASLDNPYNLASLLG